MKTTRFLSASLACALFATGLPGATDIITGWQIELDFAQQAYNQDAEGRARADALVATIVDAARNGIPSRANSSRPAEAVPAGANLDAAAAQAAYSALSVFYPGRLSSLDATLAESLASMEDTASAITAGREWGRHVAEVLIGEQSGSVSPGAAVATEAFRSSAVPTPVPGVLAAQAPIGPGRYRFTVLAGSPGTKGYVDSVGASARFDNPSSIAVDAWGNVFVAEPDLGIVRKISPDGVVSTLAGLAGQKGSDDGRGAAARFNTPFDLAVDSVGNVYASDPANHTIRKIDPTGNVTTLAGKAGESGTVSGSKESGRLNSPSYLAVDDAGNVWVSESEKSRAIRKVAPDGSISTPFIGLPTHYLADYIGVYPLELGVDHTGVLYVVYTDAWDFVEVVKFTPSAAGQYEGKVLLVPSSVRWERVSSIALDDADNLYVQFRADPICRIAPGGETEIRYSFGNSGGYWWQDLCLDKFGKLLALPSPNNADKSGAIEVGIFDPAATGIAISLQPGDNHTFTGNGIEFGVDAAGAGPLTYQWFFNSLTIPGATGTYLSVSNVKMEHAGSYSVVVTGDGQSVTSRSAKLAVTESPPSGSTTAPAGSGTTTPGGSPTSGTGSPDPAHATSGGGSFSGGISLSLLVLLSAAAAFHGKWFAGSRVRIPCKSGDNAIATRDLHDKESGT